MKKHVLFIIIVLFVGSQVSIAQDHVSNTRSSEFSIRKP